MIAVAGIDCVWGPRRSLSRAATRITSACQQLLSFTQSMTRIALLGCGAIAASFHAPALARRGDRVRVTCIDADRQRARTLAEILGGTSSASLKEAVAELDAVIIATPARTHATLVAECLEAGLSVLCEKPLASTLEEVQAIHALARATNGIVAVNQTRRFIPACAEIRSLLRSGVIGELQSVEIAEGDVFDWPAATPAMFGARSGGRGVLLDIGVHVIDLLNWWLPEPLVVERYRDDSFGGSEASVRAELRSGSCSVSVRLSWLAKQPNRYVFTGSLGTIVWGVYDLDRVTVTTTGSGTRTVISKRRCSDFASLADLVLDDFLAAHRGERSPMATPDDAERSMALIQTCYDRRERFDMPWHAFPRDVAHA